MCSVCRPIIFWQPARLKIHIWRAQPPGVCQRRSRLVIKALITGPPQPIGLTNPMEPHSSKKDHPSSQHTKFFWFVAYCSLLSNEIFHCVEGCKFIVIYSTYRPNQHGLLGIISTSPLPPGQKTQKAQDLSSWLL